MPTKRPAKLAFVDTETTGLDRRQHEIWEIGIITADPYEDGSGYEYKEYLSQPLVNLASADPGALRINGFYDRAKQWTDGPGNSMNGQAARAFNADIARDVVQLTQGRHVVGAVPNFDTEFMQELLRLHGMVGAWHYHLICVENLAAGFLMSSQRVRDSEERFDARPPWKSTDLAEALGVTISDEDRHTALGDARWARDIYMAVMQTTG